ncbi:unnamed protein product [Pleuronectes platessa]|uniref:Uncharacterized protein n=1 Tax=Pleuronectes platessa TaxID=8262 RepID=A0A9N7U3E4_PLEPL|nr:unnamed protein product [Pleuronectes platessa]
MSVQVALLSHFATPITKYSRIYKVSVVLKKANPPETEEVLQLPIRFILNLSAAFDIVSQQMLLIIHADPGRSLRDYLPPVIPHLSDIIEGSSPRRAVYTVFPLSSL